MLVLECLRGRFPQGSIFFNTMRRAHTRECIRTRARAPTRTKIRSGTLVLARGIIFCPVTFAYIMHRMHTCASDACVPVETEKQTWHHPKHSKTQMLAGRRVIVGRIL